MLLKQKILKKKDPLPTYRRVKFAKNCNTIAEFYNRIENIITDIINNDDITTIIIVENICSNEVIPKEPDYEEEESDDESAPVVIGLEESKALRYNRWIQKRPHRINVATDDGVVPCYTNAAACIAEAYTLLNSISSQHNGPTVEWMEASKTKLFDPDSAFNTVHECAVSVKSTKLMNVKPKFVSGDIRESFIWTGILQQLPNITTIFQKMNNNSGTEIDEVEDENEERINKNISQSDRYLSTVFPFSAYNGSSIKCAAVIGGLIRAEKFRVIDELIDLVDTIYIVGEISLAFLCLSSNYKYTRYLSSCAPYYHVCKKLLGHARMKGCALILPIDLVCADEEITSDMKRKGCENIDPDSRSDGFEYDGDVKTIKIAEHSSEEGEGIATPVAIDGFIYDIGPETCELMRNDLPQADFVFVWGTAGLCEASSFQNGQQCLIECTTIKPGPENTAAANMLPPVEELQRNPQRSVLSGDSTVEWYTRFMDSDGELEGNLIGAGIVSYCCRDSAVFTGLLGLFPSKIIQETLHYRPAVENEWVYSKRIYDEDEEEDDESEEESDEED